MARVVFPKSKIRARRKKQRIVVATSAALALLFVFGCLAWFSHASFMRIDTIEVTGQSALSASTISKATLDDISGSYLYLFPKNNIFLYPKYQTQIDLVNQLPTISKVSIQARNFHTISVSVVERARKALWCGSEAATSGACFWLDQDGVAYAAAADLTLDTASSTYERYYGALEGVSPQQFITPDQFHSLSALVDALAQNQQFNRVESVAVDQASDVRVTFANGFTLLFSLTSAGADVYQRFLLALGSDVFAGRSLGDFQYLDLRFGDKLYYKLRDNLTPVKSAQ